MPGNKAFGDRIRQLREEKKQNDPRFSLRRFAEAVDLSPTFLSKMELGDFDPPKPDKIKKMAELLGVDADELLALAGKVDPALSDIIKEQPKAMADFLRTAKDMNVSDAELRKLTDKLRRRKD